MGRPEKIRELAGMMLAIVTGMVVAHPASGAVAYLPSTGPAPLRFELETPAAASLAWQPVPPVKNTNAPALAVENLTNNVVARTNAVSAVSGSPSNLVDQATSEVSPDSTVVPVRAGDSSSPVTPQILAEYFKPVPGGTNPAGTAVFMPGEIGFTPPSPKAAPESRATYKTQ